MAAVLASMIFWRAHVLSSRDIDILTGQVDSLAADWDAKKVPAGKRVVNFIISDSDSGEDPFVEAPDLGQWQRAAAWLGNSVVGGNPVENHLTVFAESFQGDASNLVWVHKGFSTVNEKAMAREVSRAIVKAHDAEAEINFVTQGRSVGPVLKALKGLEGTQRKGVKVGANKVVVVGTSWPKLKRIPSIASYDFSRPGNILELANVWAPSHTPGPRKTVILLHTPKYNGTEFPAERLWPLLAEQTSSLKNMILVLRQRLMAVESLEQAVMDLDRMAKEREDKEAADRAALADAEARRKAEESAQREAGAQKAAEDAKIAAEEAAEKEAEEQASRKKARAAGADELQKLCAKCCSTGGGSWRWPTSTEKITLPPPRSHSEERQYAQSAQAKWGCCEGADWPLRSNPSCRAADRASHSGNGSCGGGYFRCNRP